MQHAASTREPCPAAACPPSSDGGVCEGRYAWLGGPREHPPPGYLKPQHSKPYPVSIATVKGKKGVTKQGVIALRAATLTAYGAWLLKHTVTPIERFAVGGEYLIPRQRFDRRL